MLPFSFCSLRFFIGSCVSDVSRVLRYLSLVGYLLAVVKQEEHEHMQLISLLGCSTFSRNASSLVL